MQQAIAQGRIGDLLHVEANFSGPGGYNLVKGVWRSTRKESPAGGMTARGLHTLDGMIALNGPVKSVFAYSDRRKIAVDIDDTTSMLLRFANGTTGYLSSIFATANYWRIHAFGTDGWAEMRGERSLSISDLKGNVETKEFDATSLERAILENFAQAAKSQAPFVVTGTQAINGIATLEAIDKSADAGAPVLIEKRGLAAPPTAIRKTRSRAVTASKRSRPPLKSQQVVHAIVVGSTGRKAPACRSFLICKLK
jgi:predicted dehydrogenase